MAAMNPTDLLSFCAGLAVLIVGGDALVRGAAGLARSFGVSPLVVGLTIVAFGTSAPELAVSMASALSGSADIALGNVVGSNVFNIALVLGGVAVMTPLVVTSQLIRFDVPVLVAASFLLAGFSLNGGIDRLEATVLFALLLLYIGHTVRGAMREDREKQQGDQEDSAGGTTELALTGLGVAGVAWPLAMGAVPLLVGGALITAGVVNVLLSRVGRDGASRAVLAGMMLVGLLLVPLSADVLVTGAVGLARSFGVSDAVIGLTVVAAGTSAPEAITSFMAARRGEADLAIGNVIGSNIFNVLCIVGLTGMVTPLPVAGELMSFDYPFLLALTVGLWPLLWWRRTIRRGDGLLMLACFAAFMAVQMWRIL